MRVLVCGGRTFGEVPKGTMPGTFQYAHVHRSVDAQRRLLRETLNALSPRPTVIIHGAAKGADRLADVWARENKIKTEPYPANWYPNNRKSGLDRSAGPRRNQKMIDEGKPDLVVAFPGGTGTDDLVSRAIDAGIKIMRVHEPKQSVTIRD